MPGRSIDSGFYNPGAPMRTGLKRAAKASCTTEHRGHGERFSVAAPASGSKKARFAPSYVRGCKRLQNGRRGEKVAGMPYDRD
jgi:hypothetical protein